MKLITRNTDYALRVLLYMAHENGAKRTASQLIEKLKIPGPFLRRLLQELGSHGMLRSHKGKGGGFTLNLAPGKIRVIDVMRIFQGNVEIDNCMFKKRICPDKARCPLRTKMNSIEKKVIAGFSSITIGSLLGRG